MQNKKVAAALAAVQLYLQQEEAEAAASALPEAISAPRNMTTEPGSWAQSGRLDMMNGRRMIALRAFSNAR
ncbi:MAG: hypothetical protein H6R17_2484 [Proteobacteria bacterium]|nr:hypothetical protein [Pseudomonadota bacterium]